MLSKPFSDHSNQQQKNCLAKICEMETKSYLVLAKKVLACNYKVE